MIDIRKEELSIMELLKTGKTNCIYPGTDLFYKTNVVREAAAISNGVRVIVRYPVEEFFFGDNNEILICKFDFEVETDKKSLFNDYDYFKNISINDFFCRMRSSDLHFKEYYPVREEYGTLARFSLDRSLSNHVKVDDIVVLVNYETDKLWILNVQLLYEK